MLDLALSLGGHTHPRALADAFLRRLRMQAGAAEARLLLVRGDDDGGEAEQVFARSFDLRRQDPLLAASDQSLVLPGLGRLHLLAAAHPLDPARTQPVLDGFVRAFLATVENERENRQLHAELERCALALETRNRLVADGAEALRLHLRALPPLLNALDDGQATTASRLGELRQRLADIDELLHRAGLGPASATPAVAASAAGIAAADAAPAASRALRILVAEDFEPLREMFRLQLELLGHQVDCAADGAEALRLWLAQRHDLVFTDLNMPLLDGCELARALRFHQGGEGPRLPIVGVTASSEPAELERCRAAGMSEVLAKPVELPALERAVKRWSAASASAEATARPPAGPADDALLDLERIYRMLGRVDRDEAVAIAAAFIEHSRHDLDAAGSADAARAPLLRALHKQKSGARSIGALRYADLCERLEAEIRRDGAEAETGQALARLWFALDELAEALAAQQPVAGPTPVAAGAALAHPPRSALIADDDAVLRRQLDLLLRGLGVSEVLQADTGVAARDLLARVGGEVEVLFCDLDMPDMDGLELLQVLGRARYPGAIVLVSGADSGVLASAGRLATLHGLRLFGTLAKPFARGEVADLLEQCGDGGESALQSVFRIAPQAILTGIARGEFMTWQQPQLDSRNLRPLALSALARWRRGDGSFVAPGVFMRAAESMRLLEPLSEMLFRHALVDLARVRAAGWTLQLGVNLSAGWLEVPDLPRRALDLVREYGIEPAEVIFEVAESSLGADPATALDALTRLRLRGFGLALDNFGLGYSSLDQLRRFPFEEVKLDRSFVTHCSRDASSRALLESTLAIARRLGWRTVAEGVEFAGDLALVRELGCDRVQGFHLGEPMPLDALLDWLRAHAG